jgi:hypothetical protein
MMMMRRRRRRRKKKKKNLCTLQNWGGQAIGGDKRQYDFQ